jgi:hypothetical protein
MTNNRKVNQDAGRNFLLCCYVHKNHQGNACSKRDWGQVFFRRYYGPFLMKFPVKVIMSTYQISLIYLERQKSYGPDKLRWEEVEVEEKIRLKQYVSLRSKGRHNYLNWKFHQKCEIDQWYLVCGCMTSRSNNCYLNSIIQLIMCNLLLYRCHIKGRHKF